MSSNLSRSSEKTAGNSAQSENDEASGTDNKKDLNASTSWTEYPWLALKGFVMGSADVVPGVSGGTMALIMGIYNKLIHTITSVDGSFLKNLFTLKLRKAADGVDWRFLVMLFSGILLAIVFFTRIIPLQKLMYTQPELIYGLYFGLIAGSILLLIYALKEITWTSLTGLVLGTVIGYTVVNLVPTNTPEDLYFIFISGAIAITAMILPGISGSFLLLILGKYQFILSQIASLGGSDTMNAILILAVFAIGMVAGLGVFSRILSWLLDHFYLFTITVLIGFLIGSLVVIWPFQNRSYQEFTSVKVVEAESQLARTARGEIENDDPMEDLTVLSQNGNELNVEVTKKKLIKSEPFWPLNEDLEAEIRPDSTQIYTGFLSIVAGFLIIGVIGYFADPSEII